MGDGRLREVVAHGGSTVYIFSISLFMFLNSSSRSIFSLAISSGYFRVAGNLRKHPFLLALRRRGRFARRNVVPILRAKRPHRRRARRNGSFRRLGGGVSNENLLSCPSFFYRCFLFLLQKTLYKSIFPF